MYGIYVCKHEYLFDIDTGTNKDFDIDSIMANCPVLLYASPMIILTALCLVNSLSSVHPTSLTTFVIRGITHSGH